LRTSESRPDWVPSLPRGPAVLTRPVRSLRPPLAPSSRGQALSPRRAFHLPELSITRRHRGFTRVHPPGLPPRLLTLDGTGPLGLAPRASHPGRQDLHGARQGRGRASSTRPELYARHQHRTSFPLTHSQCATSCRTIGDDMSRFPTAGHLASWAGTVPGSNESAGKVKSSRTRPGNPYLQGALGTAAMSCAQHPGTYLNAKYRRIATRRGPQKANVALQHAMLIAIWNMGTNGTFYQDPGGDYFARLNPGKARTRAIRQLESLGYTVTLASTS
jgi:transposase